MRKISILLLSVLLVMFLFGCEGTGAGDSKIIMQVEFIPEGNSSRSLNNIGDLDYESDWKSKLSLMIPIGYDALNFSNTESETLTTLTLSLNEDLTTSQDSDGTMKYIISALDGGPRLYSNGDSLSGLYIDEISFILNNSGIGMRYDNQAFFPRTVNNAAIFEAYSGYDCNLYTDSNNWTRTDNCLYFNDKDAEGIDHIFFIPSDKFNSDFNYISSSRCILNTFNSEYSSASLWWNADTSDFASYEIEDWTNFKTAFSTAWTGSGNVEDYLYSFLQKHHDLAYLSDSQWIFFTYSFIVFDPIDFTNQSKETICTIQVEWNPEATNYELLTDQIVFEGTDSERTVNQFKLTGSPVLKFSANTISIETE